MTVAQLIAKLQKLPQDAVVVMDGEVYAYHVEDAKLRDAHNVEVYHGDGITTYDTVKDAVVIE